MTKLSAEQWLNIQFTQWTVYLLVKNAKCENFLNIFLAWGGKKIGKTNDG